MGGPLLRQFYYNEPTTDSEVCSQKLAWILAVCDEMGVPLVMEMLEGPSTCLTFLGIEVDTLEGVLCLPPDKPARMNNGGHLWMWQCQDCTALVIEDSRCP